MASFFVYVFLFLLPCLLTSLFCVRNRQMNLFKELFRVMYEKVKFIAIHIGYKISFRIFPHSFIHRSTKSVARVDSTWSHHFTLPHTNFDIATSHWQLKSHSLMPNNDKWQFVIRHDKSLCYMKFFFVCVCLDRNLYTHTKRTKRREEKKISTWNPF